MNLFKIFGNVKKVEEVEAEITALKADIADKDAKLAGLPALESKITALEAEVTTLKADKAALEQKVVDTEASVESRVAARALEITGAAGVPAVPSKPGNVTGVDELDQVRAELAAEKDPVKKSALALKARELRGHKDLFSEN